ncbi:hypothetical protein [Streptomyces adelaidensis]|uniref:hypothetical protein n=1 Tax=Streptomyces adelaidensis TaxID=2796465 RepID=UPI0019032A11|nr:hypothetical protein [Streptomyces adelaidensis]
MGLYHSVSVVYGFEIPNRTDIDDIDRACFGQPDSPDSVGYIVVGDRDQLILATRCTLVDENEVVRITPDTLAEPADLTAWASALHAAAVRLGLADHPAPAWLVIHNYR